MEGDSEEPLRHTEGCFLVKCLFSALSGIKLQVGKYYFAVVFFFLTIKEKEFSPIKTIDTDKDSDLKMGFIVCALNVKKTQSVFIFFTCV